MKFCMVDALREVVLRFEFHKIKEVIANIHGKLSELMIAQTPYSYYLTKILKLVDPRRSYNIVCYISVVF